MEAVDREVVVRVGGGGGVGTDVVVLAGVVVVAPIDVVVLAGMVVVAATDVVVRADAVVVTDLVIVTVRVAVNVRTAAVVDETDEAAAAGVDCVVICVVGADSELIGSVVLANTGSVAVRAVASPHDAKLRQSAKPSATADVTR